MNCYECGGELKRSVTTLHLQKGQKPIFIENVPVTACQQCAEEYISGPVAEKMGQILDKDQKPQALLSIPLFDFKLAM